MKLQTEWVSYESRGESIPAFRARPERAPESVPAIVVIHEVYGVEEHIEDITQRFATAGYEAIAPDLWAAGGARPEAITRERVAAVRAFLAANPAAWSGAKAREEALARLDEAVRDRLSATMARLLGTDEGRAERFARYTEIMRGAVAYLRAQSGADGRKVGSIGFCMGGGISGLLACSEPSLNAAVVFYGSPPPIDKIENVACPVLGHYAEPDPRITPNIPAFADAMHARGRSFEYHVYSGAPHAFFNDTTGAYRLDAARAAWARTLAFFVKHLA